MCFQLQKCKLFDTLLYMSVTLRRVYKLHFHCQFHDVQIN
jgi:hypothetical protein